MFEQAKSGGKQALKRASKLYQSGDNFLRVMMFEAETQRYRKALPDATREELEQLAAHRVGQTYQDYSNLPKIMEELRRVPLVGPFASFSGEIVRTGYNNAKIGIKEVQSDNSEIRKIGAKRLIGTAMMSSLGPAALQQIGSHAVDVADDELEDIREFVAPWSKMSNIIPWGRDREQNSFQFVDLSYSNPYETISKPVNNILFNTTGASFDERVKESLGEFVKPFIGGEIFTKSAVEALMNEEGMMDNKKQPIYNTEKDNWPVQAIAHIAKSFKPGAVQTAQDMTKKFTDIGGEASREASATNSLMGLLGLQVTEVNLGKSLQFIAQDFNSQYRNDRKIYNSAYYDNSKGKQEVETAYKKANQKFRDNWKNMRETIRKAYRLGMSQDEIRLKLDKGSVPNWVQKSLIDGRFEPFDRKDRQESNPYL